MLELLPLSIYFLTINSFIFNNDVKDVFDVGRIFVWIQFFVLLVIKSKVYHPESDFVIDRVESSLREGNLDMEGVDSLWESIM